MYDNLEKYKNIHGFKKKKKREVIIKSLKKIFAPKKEDK